MCQAARASVDQPILRSLAINRSATRMAGKLAFSLDQSQFTGQPTNMSVSRFTSNATRRSTNARMHVHAHVRDASWPQNEHVLQFFGASYRRIQTKQHPHRPPALLKLPLIKPQFPSPISPCLHPRPSPLPLPSLFRSSGTSLFNASSPQLQQ